MNLKPLVRWAAVGILLLAASGCKRTTTVTGTVTCDGEAVAKGAISFQPADGRGPSCGGPIVGGRYRIEAAPGRRIVQITVVRAVQFDLGNPDESRFAAEAAARGDRSGTYDRVDLTAAAAQGNGVAVDVQDGRQTLDFALNRSKSPSSNRNH